MLERTQWRHADESTDRDAAVLRTAAMLNGRIAHARTLRLRLAPFVGIACPGKIDPSGAITRSAQHLPDDWDADGVRIADALRGKLDRIAVRTPGVPLHNAGTVQRLSEAPRMRTAPRWGAVGSAHDRHRPGQRQRHQPLTLNAKAPRRAPSRPRC